MTPSPIQFWKEWCRNHRHRGGLPALLRCLMGSYRLQKAPTTQPLGRCAKIESLSFSVVPQLTYLWASLMQNVLPQDSRIIVGDCSGGFSANGLAPGVVAYPLLNKPHGEKLDLFMHSVCRAQLVVVSDDDVFWLNSEPLRWALSKFEGDEKLAVVSLMPRGAVSSVLKGRVEQPMGSYCLIIRRDIWLKERLSFSIVQPPPENGYDWFYDTADFANVELLRKGYRIAVAPEQIRSHLCCLEAISTWTLKIQQRKGDLERSVSNIGLRRVKAYRAIRTLRGLSLLVCEHFPAKTISEPVRLSFLDRAEALCVNDLPSHEKMQIEAEVADIFARLTSRLAQIRMTRLCEGRLTTSKFS